MDQDNEPSRNVEANHHLKMSVEEFLSPIFNFEISFLNITNMQPDVVEVTQQFLL